MFKGLGALAMEPFSFSFSGGVVTGPNFAFDLRAPLSVATEAEKEFYRSNPGQLIHFIYEAWNKQFNPQCILAGGNLYLGVTWDTSCLIASGTPNLLGNAGVAIQTAVAAWGSAYLGPAPAPPTTGGGGTTTGGGTTGGSTTGGGSSTGGSGSTPTGDAGFLGLGLSSDTMLWIGAGVLVLFMLKR